MEQARSTDDVLAELREIAANDGTWGFGRAFTYVFDGPDLGDLTAEAMRLFAGSNGLDPTAFPSFVRFENDLVAFARTILHGDDEIVGSVTSGGTESIILATKAARDALRATGVDGRLNMVVPITGHAAFHKAAAYLDLDIRTTAVDEGFRAIPDAIEGSIDERTALVVASAPSYTHGVVDPVADIGAIAKGAGRWLHVDACVGGMVLPFIDDSPSFDFSIDAVDSMSMDLHKYGYTPKGASLVLYRNAALRSHQFFATAGWTGYPVANATVQSTRSAASLAAAWAAVSHLGPAGYRALAADSMRATTELLGVIRANEALELVTEPDSPLVAVTSADVFGHAQAMKKRGWMVGVTPSFAHSPAHMHLTITAAHLPLVGELSNDLVETAPTESASGSILGGMDLRDIDPSMIGVLLDSLDLDRDRALVDAAIDSLDPDARAAVISAFLQHLYR
ncbi:MAG: aminotransferase class V-fold PLP-dependent enzyme [Acidimicrobiia bacterium]|nr:aminotransferase class V-fold PLP-dependent enzyme [Acidimicrobiia bacterium]